MGFGDWLKSLFGGAKGLTEQAKEQIKSSSVSGMEDVEGEENIHVHGTGDDAKVIRRVPGADLVEEDGERLWVSRHDSDVPVEQWKDVWGPLGGRTDDALVKFFHAEQLFNETQQQDADAAEAKLRELGFKDAGEFFAARLTVLKHFGTRQGPNLGDAIFDSQLIASASMKANRLRLDQEMAAKVQANPELLAPIEGITIEQYAQISAKQATGLSQADFLKLLGEHKLDLGAWNKVSQGWTDRMSKDTSTTLAQVYGKAFQVSGQGQFGAASQAHAATGWDGTAAGGAEPIPFEKACEIQGATSAWANSGKDVNALLMTTFKLNAQDWAAANTWWMSQLTANIARFEEYNKLVAKYEAQYMGNQSKPDSDLQF